MSELADGVEELPVLYHVAGQVAEIVLNRPAKLNAISNQMHEAVLAGLESAAADDDVRVVVIKGNGRAFSAGGDIRSENPDPPLNPRELARAIWNLEKPVVARVHGYCLGQAYELVCVCDLTIASEDARFGEAQVANGWGPPILITPYVMSYKHAAEMLLMGELVDAADAARFGIVNRVVPRGELDAAVAAVTQRLISLTPMVLASNKKLLHRVYEQAGYAEASTWPTRPPLSSAQS